jgi:hypothetical protein
MNRKNTQHLVDTTETRLAYFEKLLKQLCTDLGPHPSGTRAYEKACKIILKEMAQAAPVAFLDRYLDYWAVVPRYEILHEGTRLDVMVAENCAGTSDAGFKGVIRKLKRGPTPYGIVDRSTRQMAAYLAVSDEVGPKPEYLFGDDVLSLPRFVMGIRDIPFVDLLVKDKAQVEVRVRVVHAPQVPTYNVVGTFPGRSKDEILFVAHADTLIQTEGANDNTATAIVMLMLAHAFSRTRPRQTLTFLITGSEEYGLLGAKHYVKRRIAEATHKDLKFIVNHDSLTYGPNLWTSTDDEELMGLVKSIHTDLDMKTDPIYDPSACWMNDAAPFKGINNRLRGINFNSRGYDTLGANHTPRDDSKQVPRDCAESSFVVLKELIERLQEM